MKPTQNPLQESMATITTASNLRCAGTRFSPPLSHQLSFLPKRLHFPLTKSKPPSCDSITRAVDGQWKPNLSSSSSSSWDADEPFEILPNGKRAYLDEADVVTFLDPPKELVPLDPTSYNPAAYLWKKIGDIPEERRCRLLQLLDPRLVKRAWEIAGTRYEDAKLVKKCSSNLLSGTDRGVGIEYWNCRASGGPLSLPWLNSFKKAIFIGQDGNTYGRIIVRSVVPGFPKMLSPLYFTVKESKEVISTEQPCDFAYDLGDGLLVLNEYPHGFPRPAKHPHPFSDQVVIYIRNVGPGVLIGQAWQEGVALEQVPRKLCDEILMAKEYDA